MTRSNYPEQIISLWSVFLLGLLFHTQLGLMPLFHGLNVVASQASNMEAIAPVMWLMLAFFALPMVAIVGTVMTHARRFRTIHFWFASLYTLLNLSHLIADLMVQPIIWYQIVLILILFVIGLLINLIAWQWMRDGRNTHMKDRERFA